MIQTITTGFIAENCYIYYKDNHALVIDPGQEGERIVEWINSKGLKVEAVLLTHGHFDHIGAVDMIVNHYQCPFYMNLEDKVLIDYYTYEKEAKKYRVSVLSDPLDIFTFKSQYFDIKCLKAPGHSPGSTLIIADHQYLFSGDVLFKGSIGRTDFPLSNHEDMLNTLEMIKDMNPNLKVYPGHEAPTTIKEELNSNPFLK